MINSSGAREENFEVKESLAKKKKVAFDVLQNLESFFQIDQC
jgi:hypothetical protein